MSIARKVAYNTAVLIIGRVVTIGLSLVLIKYLTNYLGVKGYGDYTTAINFVLIFATIADFGLNNIVVRQLSQKNVDVNEYVGNVLGLRSIVALVVLVLGGAVSLLFPYSRDVILAIFVIAAANYCLTLNQVFVGVFQANMKIDRASIAEITGRLVAFGLAIWFIRMNYGFMAIMATILAGNFINLLISWWFSRSFIRPSIRYNKEIWRKLFWEMMPMGTVLVLGMLYIKSDVIVLSVVKGSNAVGVYGVAYKFFEILIALPAFFMGAVLPFIVQYYHHEREKFNNLLQKSTDVLVIAGLPIPIFFGILAPKLVSAVSGGEFMGATNVLRVMAFGVTFSFIAQMAAFTLIAIHKQGALILIYGVLLAENVILNLILIPHFSYMGAAWVNVLTQFLALIGAWWMLYKYTNFRVKLGIWVKVAAAVLLTGVTLWVMKDNLIFGAVAAVGLYLILLAGMGVVTKDMVKGLAGKG